MHEAEPLLAIGFSFAGKRKGEYSTNFQVQRFSDGFAPDPIPHRNAVAFEEMARFLRDN
jgi:hypothetical protein